MSDSAIMHWLRWALGIPRFRNARLPNLKWGVCTYRRISPTALWVELLVSAPSRVTFSDMDRAITMPARVIAWLLFAVLLCLVIAPPHCDLCDGPLDRTSFSRQAIVNQQQPTTPERCNGICWCCGFHGLPNPSSRFGPGEYWDLRCLSLNRALLFSRHAQPSFDLPVRMSPLSLTVPCL